MNASNLNPSSSLINTPWPAGDLERVSACPVCGSAKRTVLHEGLIDNVFFVALGRWTLHCCKQCRSAYLDPRPSPASIHKAYGTYYTHEAGGRQDDAARLSLLRRLRRTLANGYLNHRYGTQRQPATRLGVWMAKILPGQRQALDSGFRYLPKPIQGQRLLDIGCGNGDFLVDAREAGWHVSGVEPDPKAAAAAWKRDLDVTTGTVDKLAAKSSCFDVITISHVIEHVHDPIKLLKAAHRLLKPGGVVYIDTPNIGSDGAQLFGKNWRGLETPRHLVLFNLASLTSLLSATGYNGVKTERRTTVWQFTYLSSLRMASGNSPYGQVPARLPWFERLRLSIAFTETAHLEFITLTARKGDV